MLTDESELSISPSSFGPPPPPPPPPPLAFVPPPPPMPGVVPNQPYNTRKTATATFADQDPDIQKILDTHPEAEARTGAFRTHLKLLKDERIVLNREIDTLNERKRFNENTDQTLDALIRDLGVIQISTETELKLLNEVQTDNNQSFTLEELEEAKSSLLEKQKFLLAELKEAQEKKKALAEKNNKIDADSSLKATEKLTLNKKISAVEEILKALIKKDSSEPGRAVKSFKIKHPRDAYEAKLCEMAKSGLFIYVVRKDEKARTVFYTPEQIFKLKIKLGLLKNSRDLHTSPDTELENILKLALQMGLNDTLLGPTPRKTLYEYLGIDVVEEHERRERVKKQEDDEKRRLAREAEKIAAEQRRKEREAEKIAEEKIRQDEAKAPLSQEHTRVPMTPTRSTKRSHADALQQASTPSKRFTMEHPQTPGRATHIQTLQQELSAEKKAKKLAEEAAAAALQYAEEERKKREQIEAEAEVERKKREAAEAAAEEERVKRARIEGAFASQTPLPSLMCKKSNLI